MKKGREMEFIEFILYFGFRVIFIVPAIVFIPLIIEEILSFEDPLIRTILLEVLILIAFFIILNNILKLIDSPKKRRIVKKIIQEIPPRTGIITDMLIDIRIIGKGIETITYNINFCPIIKDLGNKKLYVSFENLNINSSVSGPSASEPIEYILKSLKGNEIKIGQHVNLHIQKEKRKILAYNRYVTINETEYKYMGKISDFLLKKYDETELLFNVSSDNFLNELKELIIYEGVVDFDIYNKV